MPTVLPHRRRVSEKRSLARTVFDVLFNATMVVSALILTFIVLVRQEQYAYGRRQSPPQAIEQTAHPSALEMTGENRVMRPSN